MPEPTVLRAGSRGEPVRDLQRRLNALGFGCEPDEPGIFAAHTEDAVRRFQEHRGLPVDGVVGAQTWSALVESGFTLGDRLLYLRHPMLRGDDVAALQRRLNALGFDVGRVDGIFGEESHRALVDFQRSAGLLPDGICGPSTIAALDRVDGLAAGSIASVRERDALRHGHAYLEGQRVFVATTPGLAVVGDALLRELSRTRAIAIGDSSGDDDAVVARTANEFSATLFLSLRSGTGPCPQCVYFEATGFRSETGYVIASEVATQLTPVLGSPVALAGRAYPALRETRMAAIVCELLVEGHAEALAAVVRRAPAVARAIVRGIQLAYERSAEQPTEHGSR